MPDYWQ